MRPDIKIILWGLGAMGSGIARLLLKKKGVRIVAAFDRDPTKAGKDLGELLGLENYGVKVGFPPTDGGNWPEQAKVMLLATSSFTQEVVGEINAGVGQGLNVITIAEEMSYPWVQARVFDTCVYIEIPTSLENRAFFIKIMSNSSDL